MDNNFTADAAYLKSALALATKINDDVAELLQPLERKMTIMRWPPEFQVIMWEAVISAARKRMEAGNTP